jgi:hypothetical protein
MSKTSRCNVSWRVSVAAGALILLGPTPGMAPAAAPQISNVTLRGLQRGAITTLTIEGSDLLPDPRLLLAVPIASQAIKEAATPKRVDIEVTLSPNISSGIYQLRLANTKGVSNPALISIDDLEQPRFGPQIARLPAALHGNLPTSETLNTSFTGRKGQRIVLDLEARRLGAAIDPVVELYDSRQVQLAYSQGHAILAGDARLEVVLPADGKYTIELRDILYRAGKPNHFRLKVGELYYGDRIFPLGGQRGTETSFDLIGMIPPAARQIRVDLHGALADIPVPLPPIQGLTGMAPRIVVDDFPEVMEVEPPAGKLQEVTVPAVINGRIGKPGEEDRYRLLVKPGRKLRFDVLASGAGSPLDGVLFLRNESGAQLAMSDDRPNTTDPGLDFTVPSGSTSLVVALTDLLGRGGNDYIYRLAITPADRPDFSLTMFEDRQVIPEGGTAVFRIRASRAGYQGAIRLSLPDLPEGVIASGNEIPAGATDTLVSLSASSGVRPAQLVTRIVGASDDPKKPIQRLAMLPVTALTELQPWLRSEFAVAVTEPGPVQIAWGTGEAPLPIGTRHPVRVKVARGTGVSGPIRLSLLTNQNVPKTADGKQDDVKRALRIDGTPMIAADQVNGEAPILVPPDLPAGTYDLAVRAELLSTDSKSVLATAITPSRRLQALRPFTLQLAGPGLIEAKSGSGVTGKLRGKVIRASGFTSPVTVTLAGLPAGLTAPTAIVPGDKSEFELSVAFPEDTKLGALLNIKLSATSQIAPQQIVKAAEIPVSIQLVQGSAPPTVR